jgi:hypothetical protein
MIVGIVPDSDEDGPVSTPLPQIYLPYQQNPVRIGHLLVRTSSGPQSPARAIRKEISPDRSGPAVFDIKTLDQMTSHAFATQESAGAVLSIFAGLALIWSAVGIYGVVSATARIRELAIRMAIGARRVLRLVLAQALQPAVAGVAIGAAGVAATNRLLAVSWQPY